MTRLFVVGANGKLGWRVVEQALADGHRVTAFVRWTASTTISTPRPLAVPRAELGAVAARDPHGLGAQVVLVGRSPDRTAALAADLGVPGHTVDFARLDDVRGLARRLRDELPRIDVLAANAGGIPTTRTPTADGIEPERHRAVAAPAPADAAAGRRPGCRDLVRGAPAAGSPLLADRALGAGVWDLARRLVGG